MSDMVLDGRNGAPLTSEQKALVWDAINKHFQPEDRPAFQVICENYGNDENVYLRVMANYHRVKL